MLLKLEYAYKISRDLVKMKTMIQQVWGRTCDSAISDEGMQGISPQKRAPWHGDYFKLKALSSKCWKRLYFDIPTSA